MHKLYLIKEVVYYNSINIEGSFDNTSQSSYHTSAKLTGLVVGRRCEGEHSMEDTIGLFQPVH